MSRTPTYDPGQHFASFGSIPLLGIADGTFISVERISEAFTSVAGAGGEVARVRMRDKRGKIKVTLMATSPTNDLLSAVAQLDETTGAGEARFHITDGNGTTRVMAANAWISKLPSTEFSKDMPHRDWEFECDNLELFVGGNR